MAVTDVSAAYQNPVGPLLQGLEDEIRGNPARTHDPDHPDIGWVLHSADTGQISAGISTPVTAKSDDFRFELSSHRVFFLFNLVVVQAQSALSDSDVGCEMCDLR